jgi:AcrR family transcriptional regulator
MAQRPRLNEDKVVEAAIELVNQYGADRLSLAELAGKLNVRPPSLYNHIDGLAGLRRLMTLRGLQLLTSTLQNAVMGRAGFEALTALAEAYRDFAGVQPGLYQLTLRSTEANDPELRAAGQAAVAVALAVFRGYGLTGDAALHATRCLRSSLHGFVSLEAAGGFALDIDLDQSFALLLRTLDCGFCSQFDQPENMDT